MKSSNINQDFSCAPEIFYQLIEIGQNEEEAFFSSTLYTHNQTKLNLSKSREKINAFHAE